MLKLKSQIKCVYFHLALSILFFGVCLSHNFVDPSTNFCFQSTNNAKLFSIFKNDVCNIISTASLIYEMVAEEEVGFNYPNFKTLSFIFFILNKLINLICNHLNK